MRKTMWLTLLSLLTAAGAQSAPRANVFAIDVVPEQQQIAVSLDVDLGFPLGKRVAVLELDCAKKTPAKVTGYKESFEGYGEDPEGAKGVLAARVVQVAGQSATVNAWYRPLTFSCQQGRVTLDYSKLAADPAALFAVHGMDTRLNIERVATSTSLSFTVPVMSRAGTGGNAQSAGVNIRIRSSGRRVIEAVNVGGVARSGKQALFLYNAGTKTLAPLQYGGDDAGARKVVGQAVGNTVELYYAPDYSVPTGWRKTTIDLIKSLIWWAPASMPAGAKFAR
ncbi:hypothetical protein [Deinococcus aestuarii]|uniref:hypothetical protein n=1 Tax=Deinococcus aestuarii TaxID=2774531 RepID=UPI001C0DFD10|nr:hypothetical protein [Deinococcus aestuarii]